MQNVQPPNLLLTGIPAQDLHHIFANCECVELECGDVLSAVSTPVEYVYFPLSAVISLYMPVPHYSKLEVGMIGNEGMLGAHHVLGINSAPFSAVVQTAGVAERMSVPGFLQELENNAAFKVQLMRYLFVLMSQLIQAVGCHRFHLLEERLARLLLMIKDRTHSTDFHITQELLSQMLGVRRVGVTKAAQSYQLKGLIKYSRGNVSIQDLHGLEKASCSCYQSDKEIYDRILNPS